MLKPAAPRGGIESPMNKNKNTDTESQIQRMLVQYIKLKHPELWQVCTSVPHGGYRLKSEAARLKAEGVHAGYPDMLIDKPQGRYHGMRLEVKTLRGRLSDKQVAFLRCLNMYGYFACVGYGVDACIHLIELYAKATVLKYNANDTVVACTTPPLLFDALSRRKIITA